jgi:hypothetical protein
MAHPKIQYSSPWRGSWIPTVIAGFGFLALLLFLTWRLYLHLPTANPPTPAQWAMGSYRDAIYYPTIAVRDGVNPYDASRGGDPQRYMNRYPVVDHFPLYSPLILLVFSPLACFSWEHSLLLYWALNVVLLIFFAHTVIRCSGARPTAAAVCGLAALLLASQPGRGNFNAGQVALPLALACCGALEWGDRRIWPTAWRVAFSTLKPTFGGPLGLLLAARRDWRSSLLGLAIGGILGAACAAAVFSRSGDFSAERAWAVVAGNHARFASDPVVVPQTNNARIDLVATLELLADRSLPNWTGTLVAAVVLVSTMATLSRVGAKEEGAGSLSSALIVSAMFICVYHNSYDLPLLTVPIVAAATGKNPSWRQLSSFSRWSVLVFLLVPFVNVLWTERFWVGMNQLGIPWGSGEGPIGNLSWRIACAANGISLA